MNPKEYVKSVLITEARADAPLQARFSTVRNIRLLHGAIGLASELAEIVEMQQKRPIDAVNLKEEIGDIYWYMGIMVAELEFNPDEIFMSTALDLRRSEEESDTRDLILTASTDELAISIGTAIDLLKKSVMYGKELNVAGLKQKLIDIDETTQYMLNLYGLTAAEARARNIEKLRARYGEKFTEAAANERNLEAERAILEK